MKRLAAKFINVSDTKSKKRLGRFLIKLFLGAAAIIYAVYTISQIVTFLIKDF